MCSAARGTSPARQPKVSGAPRAIFSPGSWPAALPTSRGLQPHRWENSGCPPHLPSCTPVPCRSTHSLHSVSHLLSLHSLIKNLLPACSCLCGPVNAASSLSGAGRHWGRGRRPRPHHQCCPVPPSATRPPDVPLLPLPEPRHDEDSLCPAAAVRFASFQSC